MTITSSALAPHGVQETARTASADSGSRAAHLLFRIENVPFSRWHTKARIIMGSATLFDAFDALSCRCLWDCGISRRARSAC